MVERHSGWQEVSVPSNQQIQRSYININTFNTGRESLTTESQSPSVTGFEWMIPLGLVSAAERRHCVREQSVLSASCFIRSMKLAAAQQSVKLLRSVLFTKNSKHVKQATILLWLSLNLPHRSSSQCDQVGFTLNKHQA